jgi:hypothetical protein
VYSDNTRCFGNLFSVERQIVQLFSLLIGQVRNYENAACQHGSDI